MIGRLGCVSYSGSRRWLMGGLNKVGGLGVDRGIGE